MSSITKKLTAVVGTIAAFGLPMLVLADTPSPVTASTGGLTTFFAAILTVFNAVVPFLIAIIVIFLIVASFQFALSAGDEEKRKSARDKIVWGLVGVVLIFSIYGLVRIAAGVFQSTATSLPTLPGVQIAP